MAEFIYLVVYGKVLFYIRIGTRDVRFRLIVVVIGNEKFHSVLGEKFSELVTQLRRQRLIMRYNESRTVNVVNDVCHGKSFARPRNAQ